MKLVVLFLLFAAARAAYLVSYSNCYTDAEPPVVSGFYDPIHDCEHTPFEYCACSDEVDFQLALTDMSENSGLEIDFQQYALVQAFLDSSEACENRVVNDFMMYRLAQPYAQAVCYNGEFLACSYVTEGDCSTVENLLANCDEPEGFLLGCSETTDGPQLATCGDQDKMDCARQCAMKPCGYVDGCGPCIGLCDNEWEYCSPESFTCVPRTESFVLFYVKAFEWMPGIKRAVAQRSMTLPAYFENALLSDFSLAMGIPRESIVIQDEQFYQSERSHVLGVLLQVSYDLLDEGVDLQARYDAAIDDVDSLFYNGAVTRFVQSASDIFITDIPTFPSSLIVSEPSTTTSDSYIYSISTPSNTIPIVYSSSDEGGPQLLYLLFLLFLLLLVLLVLIVLVVLFLRVKVVIKGDEGAVVRQ